MKQSKGITLISLVITIIILLILAGISISVLTNQGLFGKVNQAKIESEIGNIKERIKLDIYQKQISNTGEMSDLELKTILEKYGTIEYESDGVTVKDIITKKGYKILLSEINSINTTEERLVANGSWQKGKGVNSPQILTGMTPIKFTDPTDSEEGMAVKTTTEDSNWYNYNLKKWANVQTQDGSMWVWIPRYAYKITYNDVKDKSKGGTISVVFLIDDTDNYYDENGKLQTAKRQKNINEIVDTTTGYTVHPAFTNETNIKYANGGWNKELKGIWVSKFEAGYATGNNITTKTDGTAYTKETVPSSSVKYTQDTAWGESTETGTGKNGTISARNWLDGEYGSKETFIKYPTFQGTTYSMNYINLSDAYNISKALTENNNIYGFTSNNTNSHLIKNSEWGAIAYLGQSKYGLDGANIYINNVTITGTTSVYVVTGCSAKTEDEEQVTTTIEDINKRKANIYTWTQKNGQKASTTGTIYGVYDMSGGAWERTSGLATNGNEDLTKCGKILINEVTKNEGDSKTYESTPYVTVYPSNDLKITNIESAATENYKINTSIYGDAIREISTTGVGHTSWYEGHSNFVGYNKRFFSLGGYYWDKSVAGLFCFYLNNGYSSFDYGFRTVIVAQ